MRRPRKVTSGASRFAAALLFREPVRSFWAGSGWQLANLILEIGSSGLYEARRQEGYVVVVFAVLSSAAAACRVRAPRPAQL